MKGYEYQECEHMFLMPLFWSFFVQLIEQLKKADTGFVQGFASLWRQPRKPSKGTCHVCCLQDEILQYNCNLLMLFASVTTHQHESLGKKFHRFYWSWSDFASYLCLKRVLFPWVNGVNYPFLIESKTEDVSDKSSNGIILPLLLQSRVSIPHSSNLRVLLEGISSSPLLSNVTVTNAGDVKKHLLAMHLSIVRNCYNKTCANNVERAML